MTCDIVLSGSPQQVSYTASRLLEVVPNPPLALGIPITWILPPYYTTSEILPRMSDPYAHLESSRGFTYSVIKVCGRSDHMKYDDIIIDGGKIRTKESKDIACVQAKDQLTGRTEIACCIRVAEVSFFKDDVSKPKFLSSEVLFNNALLFSFFCILFLYDCPLFTLYPKKNDYMFFWYVIL